MGGEKLTPLGALKPFDLSDRKEIEALIVGYFPRLIPGFTLLEADARWGEGSVDLFGKDQRGKPVAIFPTVSREEQVFLDVVTRALHAAWWVEENKERLRRVYGQHDLDWNHPLKIILVVPTLLGRSRAVGWWLERSGVEVVEYQCYESESAEGEQKGVFLGISLNAKGEALGSLGSQGLVGTRIPGVPGPGSGVPSVEAFIASLADEHLKAISAQAFSFLLSLFPDAEAVVNPGRQGFTVTAQGEPVASVYLGQGFLWLEAGPERLPTGRIADMKALEKVMKRLEPLLLHRLGRGRERHREAE